MTQARFVSEGQMMPYTPTLGDLAAGEVVVLGSGLLGVAAVPIANNTLGALTLTGVFQVAKGNATIGAGNLTYWDGSGKVATSSANGTTIMGRAVASAATGDATVMVRVRVN